eukprot:TRINITY_DN9827_c0_g1_i1.p1 TRINITY_DN9827_c0_g1~~TRINITY_DN9827_c0_g1_i1.p1  ORF type:complete len:453 (-),score=111.98 TRINITY_DN9827_c0_g1_i1:25-1293(-)
MAAPPPPPPPPVTKKANPPPARGGNNLASMLANSTMTLSDNSGNASANPADLAPDFVKHETQETKPKGDSFLSELSLAIGAPKNYKDNEPEYNPSLSGRPGYKPPSNLPQGGTQGEETVYYQLKGPQVTKVQQLTSFSIYCRNDKKELVDIDISILDAEMTNDKGVDGQKGKIERVAKGHFTVSFRARSIGKYLLNFYVRGRMERRPIYDAPVELQVIASDPIVKTNTHFTVSGFGMQGGKVGRPLFFDIVVRDEQGKFMDCDKERLVVHCSQGMKKTMGDVERVDLGKYRAQFVAPGPGEMIVTVEYGGQEVCKNKAEFNHGIEASQTEVLNPPSAVLVGQETNFTIQGRSKSGDIVNTGGEKFDVACSGPSGGVTGLVVRDELNGKYTVRFKLTKPGQYKFFVSLHGVDLKNTPISVNAK